MADAVEACETELKLFAKTSRLIMLLLLAVALIAGGMWLGIMHEEPAANVTGWVAVAFFGACSAYIMRRLVSRTPILIVDRDGIVDQASAAAAGRIAWDDIADLGIRRLGAQKFLEIHVHDVDALRARLTLARRIMTRVNGWMGFAPVNIPQTVLPIPVEELANSIAEQLDARADSSPASDRDTP